MSDSLEIMHLENGLKLELYNHSRKVAGDRWLAFFEARIEVIIKEDYFKDQNPDISVDELKKVLGEKVLFKYEKKRNFIDVREKDNIFENLKKRFLDNSLRYLSTDEFPKKFILSKFNQATAKVKSILKF